MSTTDGTAVGSTDQRYLCKDCGYRGALVVETPDQKTGQKTAAKTPPPKQVSKVPDRKTWLWQILTVLDIALFVIVLLLAGLGQITSGFGSAILMMWVIVFFATLIIFSANISQGSYEWYHYGTILITGVLIALTAGLLAGFDVYGIAVAIPFTITAVLAVNWMFMDKSEEEIDRDLEKLRREIR